MRTGSDGAGKDRKLLSRPKSRRLKGSHCYADGVNKTSATAPWSQKTRRFAGWLVLLMVLGFILSNAVVNAYRSGLPLLPTLLANVLVSLTWMLPWVAIIIVIGFLAAWGALQLGTHRPGVIEWWRGGLAAFVAAVLVATAHFGLNSGLDLLLSVQYTGDGQATEALTRMLVAIVFVILSTAAGIVLSLSRRTSR